MSGWISVEDKVPNKECVVRAMVRYMDGTKHELILYYCPKLGFLLPIGCNVDCWRPKDKF